MLTLLRVVIVVALAALVWTPIGTWIGMNPRVARFAQPVVQVTASFPANLLFPIFALVFVRLGLSLEWGGTLLMALGAQWYDGNSFPSSMPRCSWVGSRCARGT